MFFHVLSDSVSTALILTAGGEEFEMSYFIQKMHKFFDCLNVSCYTAEKKRTENHFSRHTKVQLTSSLLYVIFCQILFAYVVFHIVFKGVNILP